MEVSQKMLETKVGNIEQFLGTPQGTSLEKVMEIVNKTEETMRTQIQREMETRERRNMEVMMTKMLEERLKQTKREEHLETIKKSIEDSTRKQLVLLLDRVGKDLQAERQARKALELELSKLKAKFLREGGTPPSVPRPEPTRTSSP